MVQADIVVPETYWSGDNADDRFVEGEADVDCAHCGTVLMLDVHNSDGYVAAMIYYHEDV